MITKWNWVDKEEFRNDSLFDVSLKVFVTPMCILLDILLLPVEMISIVVYKILNRKKRYK